MRRTYLTITSTRHVCVTDVSRVLDIIFTRFTHNNLFCGWTRGDITVSSTFFWSKLWWSYNDYSQSSLAYLECQKLNDSTKGKTKHYLLLGIFFFDYIARSLVWTSWPNVFLVLIHFHPGHLKPKLRHWSGPILIKTEP